MRPALFAALSDFPAWCVFKEFLNSLNADFLGMNQFPDTFQPFDVIFRVIPVFIFSSRFNETVLFIKA